MSTNCAILFHQGYTDIINCISLVGYYKHSYNKIILFCRKEMTRFINFFIKNMTNVTCIFDEQCNIDNAYLLYSNILNNVDILFFGCHDIYRADAHKGAFGKYLHKCSFVHKFYLAYNIAFETRILYFDFIRESELEEHYYTKMNPTNEKYILTHTGTNAQIDINYINNKNNYKIINLNDSSDIFFDSIKLLMNAQEIHCIDSSWAVFIYLVDSKYKFFDNVNIFIHCVRNYNFMFETDKTNWKII